MSWNIFKAKSKDSLFDNLKNIENQNNEDQIVLQKKKKNHKKMSKCYAKEQNIDYPKIEAKEKKDEEVQEENNVTKNKTEDSTGVDGDKEALNGSGTGSNDIEKKKCILDTDGKIIGDARLEDDSLFDHRNFWQNKRMVDKEKRQLGWARRWQRHLVEFKWCFDDGTEKIESRKFFFLTDYGHYGLCYDNTRKTTFLWRYAHQSKWPLERNMYDGEYSSDTAKLASNHLIYYCKSGNIVRQERRPNKKVLTQKIIPLDKVEADRY